MGVAAEGRFAYLYDLFFDGILKSIRVKNKEIIRENHCKKIVDLGCGTGSQLQILSNNQCKMIGLDNSEKMIQIAKRKNIPQTMFFSEDILENTLSDHIFDAAIITLVLHPNDYKTIKRILYEAQRLVKKQGIIIITDYDNSIGLKGKIASGIIQIIESFANESHRKNYFSFMKQGGIGRLLTRENYQILTSISYYSGSLIIYVIKV